MKKRPTKSSQAPIRYRIFDDFFSPQTYAALCSGFDDILKKGITKTPTRGHFHPSQSQRKFAKKHDGHVCKLEREAASPFDVFWSVSFYKFVASQFRDLKLTKDVFAALHHRHIGSKSSPVHTDFHISNFLNRPLPNGMNPHSGAVAVKGVKDISPGVRHPVRAISALYYFNNPEFRKGDGGETAFYSSLDPASMYETIAPINNRLALFEVSPKSFHGSLSNRRTIRNSLALWFHAPLEFMIEKFGEWPLEY